MNRWRLLSTITLLFSALIIILLMSNRPDTETVSASPMSGGTHTIQSPQAGNDTLANCRYGSAPAIEGSGLNTTALSNLGVGWYLNFQIDKVGPQPANGAEFVHMLHVRQLKDGVDVYLPGYEIQPSLGDYMENLIQNNPGELWIVGNEVDRGPNPGETNPDNRGQDDTKPEIYALAYHDAYHFIKSIDPTAQVAISGLVEVTPGRLQYLDKVWNTYMQKFGTPMPVDMWTMHLYILPEVKPDGEPNGIANVALGTDKTLGKRESGGTAANCSDPDVYCFAEHDDLNVFAEQVVAMRQWMAQHGQRQKPLLLTEYSILYSYIDDGDTCFVQDENGECFTPERVNSFMTKTLDYLNNSATDPSLGYSLDNNRLIQQFLWFSTYSEGVGEVSNLVKNDLVTLTSLGQNYKNHIVNETPVQNLLIERVANVRAVASAGGAANAKLSVTFRNNGNTTIDQPFAVTFYKDAALSQPIATVNIAADILGCTSRPYVASAEWPGLGAGKYDYWVKIDSGNAINETPANDNDNVGKGQVTVVTNSIMLPFIHRP